MYVVLGANGHTGSVVANKLLARGKKVRVVGRNAAHLQPFISKGAEAFPADLTNAEALARAFAGAEAAYVLLPPNLTASNYRAFQDQVSDAIASAVKTSKIENVVSLSSIGADKESGTGPVAGLHNLEQKLDRIDGVNVLHLRAGYFMQNTLPQAHAIRTAGFTATPLRADLKLAMIAARDVGDVAADELLALNFKGKQTRELQGQRDLDYTEATSIIARAIGKPDLKYIQAPEDQARPVLLQLGMSESAADLILEMTRALNSGYMRALEPRSARTTTPTSFETFVAEEFLPAYRQVQVAA